MVTIYPDRGGIGKDTVWPSLTILNSSSYTGGGPGSRAWYLDAGVRREAEYVAARGWVALIAYPLRMPTTSPATFTAIGDSILAASGSFAEMIERTCGWRMVRKDGVAGTTIEQMIARAPGTVFSVSADFCVIEALTNNINTLSAAVAAEKMRTLCIMARENGQEPIIIPVGPVDSATHPKRYLNGLLINDAVRDMASTLNIKVLPIWESAKGTVSWLTKYQSSSDPGLYHPNAYGHVAGGARFLDMLKGEKQKLVSTFTAASPDTTLCYGPTNGLGESSNGIVCNNWLIFGDTTRSVVATDLENVYGQKVGTSLQTSILIPIPAVSNGDVTAVEVDIDFRGDAVPSTATISLTLNLSNGASYPTTGKRIPCTNARQTVSGIVTCDRDSASNNFIAVTIPAISDPTAYVIVSRPVFRNLTKIAVAQQSLPAGMS